MSLQLVGISRRVCPKCGSYNFYCEDTTIGEDYEICKACGYIEKGKDARSCRKVGNEPFNPRNYVKDPNGNYHWHGWKYGYHKKSVRHRRVAGETYSFAELKKQLESKR